MVRFQFGHEQQQKLGVLLSCLALEIPFILTKKLKTLNKIMKDPTVHTQTYLAIKSTITDSFEIRNSTAISRLF